MFRKLSLKKKLISAFAAMSLILIGVGGLSYKILNTVVDTYEHIVQVNLPNTYYAEELGQAFRETRIELRSLAIDGWTEDQIHSVAKTVQAAIDDYEDNAKKYESTPFAPGEREAYAELQEAWAKFKADGVKNLAFATSGKAEERAKFKDFVMNTCPVHAQHFAAAHEKLLAFQEKEAKTWAAAANADATKGNSIMLVIILVAGAGSLAVGTFLALQIANQMASVASRLSEGADHIASATQAISSASTQLSSAATEQAASLQETSASITEMSQMVGKNADNAQNASVMSTDGKAKATNGRDAIQDMIRAIEEIDQSTVSIATQMEESNRDISSVIRVIADIQEKTKVINDIVFQTKLLSFNASVEAARAGEHGKGFAVVAEEVGKLAEMSGTASKEISTLLSESLDNVDRTIKQSQEKVLVLVEASKAKVRSGSEIARSCGDVLEDLVGSSSAINQTAQEIATASEEQATGIREITKAVNQLDHVTQQNAAAADQTAQSATELSGQVAEVRNVVQELLKTLNGDTAGGALAGSGSSAAGGDSNARGTPAKAKNVVKFKGRATSGVADAGSVDTSAGSRAKKTAKNSAKAKESASATVAATSAAPSNTSSAPLKRAAGDDSFPSPDDSRFRDI